MPDKLRHTLYHTQEYLVKGFEIWVEMTSRSYLTFMHMNTFSVHMYTFYQTVEGFFIVENKPILTFNMLTYYKLKYMLKSAPALAAGVHFTVYTSTSMEGRISL